MMSSSGGGGGGDHAVTHAAAVSSSQNIIKQIHHKTSHNVHNHFIRHQDISSSSSSLLNGQQIPSLPVIPPLIESRVDSLTDEDDDDDNDEETDGKEVGMGHQHRCPPAAALQVNPRPHLPAMLGDVHRHRHYNNNTAAKYHSSNPFAGHCHHSDDEARLFAHENAATPASAAAAVLPESRVDSDGSVTAGEESDGSESGTDEEEEAMVITADNEMPVDDSDEETAAVFLHPASVSRSLKQQPVAGSSLPQSSSQSSHRQQQHHHQRESSINSKTSSEGVSVSSRDSGGSGSSSDPLALSLDQVLDLLTTAAATDQIMEEFLISYRFLFQDPKIAKQLQLLQRLQQQSPAATCETMNRNLITSDPERMIDMLLHRVSMNGTSFDHLLRLVLLWINAFFSDFDSCFLSTRNLLIRLKTLHQLTAASAADQPSADSTGTNSSSSAEEEESSSDSGDEQDIQEASAVAGKGAAAAGGGGGGRIESFKIESSLDLVSLSLSLKSRSRSVLLYSVKRASVHIDYVQTVMHQDHEDRTLKLLLDQRRNRLFVARNYFSHSSTTGTASKRKLLLREGDRILSLNLTSVSELFRDPAFAEMSALESKINELLLLSSSNSHQEAADQMLSRIRVKFDPFPYQSLIRKSRRKRRMQTPVRAATELAADSSSSSQQRKGHDCDRDKRRKRVRRGSSRLREEAICVYSAGEGRGGSDLHHLLIHDKTTTAREVIMILARDLFLSSSHHNNHNTTAMSAKTNFSSPAADPSGLFLMSKMRKSSLATLLLTNTSLASSSSPKNSSSHSLVPALPAASASDSSSNNGVSSTSSGAVGAAAGLSSLDYALYEVSASFSAGAGLIIRSRRIADSAVNLWSSSPFFSRLLLKQVSCLRMNHLKQVSSGSSSSSLSLQDSSGAMADDAAACGASSTSSSSLEKKIREELVSTFLKNSKNLKSSHVPNMSGVGDSQQPRKSSLIPSSVKWSGSSSSSSSNHAGVNSNSTASRNVSMLLNSEIQDYNPISLVELDPLLLSLFLSVNAFNLFSALDPQSLLFHVLTQSESSDSNSTQTNPEPLSNSSKMSGTTDASRKGEAKEKIRKWESLTEREMFWAINEVLSQESNQQRSKCVKILIRSAVICLDRMRNFSTAASITCALGHSSISRLRKTVWIPMQKKKSGRVLLKQLERLNQMLDPSKNMARYRQLLQQALSSQQLSSVVGDSSVTLSATQENNVSRAKKQTASEKIRGSIPVIPFYPIHKKDFTFLHLTSPTFLSPGAGDETDQPLINWNKIRTLVSAIKDFLSCAAAESAGCFAAADGPTPLVSGKDDDGEDSDDGAGSEGEVFEGEDECGAGSVANCRISSQRCGRHPLEVRGRVPLHLRSTIYPFSQVRDVYRHPLDTTGSGSEPLLSESQEVRSKKVFTFLSREKCTKEFLEKSFLGESACILFNEELLMQRSCAIEPPAVAATTIPQQSSGKSQRSASTSSGTSKQQQQPSQSATAVAAGGVPLESLNSNFHGILSTSSGRGGHHTPFGVTSYDQLNKLLSLQTTSSSASGTLTGGSKHATTAAKDKSCTTTLPPNSLYPPAAAATTVTANSASSAPSSRRTHRNVPCGAAMTASTASQPAVATNSSSSSTTSSTCSVLNPHQPHTSSCTSCNGVPRLNSSCGATSHQQIRSAAAQTSFSSSSVAAAPAATNSANCSSAGSSSSSSLEKWQHRLNRESSSLGPALLYPPPVVPSRSSAQPAAAPRNSNNTTRRAPTSPLAVFRKATTTTSSSSSRKGKPGTSGEGSLLIQSLIPSYEETISNLRALRVANLRSTAAAATTTTTASAAPPPPSHPIRHSHHPAHHHHRMHHHHHSATAAAAAIDASRCRRTGCGSRSRSTSCPRTTAASAGPGPNPNGGRSRLRENLV